MNCKRWLLCEAARSPASGRYWSTSNGEVSVYSCTQNNGPWSRIGDVHDRATSCLGRVQVGGVECGGSRTPALDIYRLCYWLSISIACRLLQRSTNASSPGREPCWTGGASNA